MLCFLVEKTIRMTRSLIKKPIFEKGNADWLSELTSIIKKYTNQTFKKENEKNVHFNLQDKRQKRKLKFQVIDFIRAAGLKKTFSKGETIIWFYKLCY